MLGGHILQSNGVMISCVICCCEPWSLKNQSLRKSGEFDIKKRGLKISVESDDTQQKLTW